MRLGQYSTGILLFLGFAWGAQALSAPPLQTPFLAPLATSTDASYNWAGYVVQGGVYTAVSASWAVPEVVPGDEPLSADAAWVGIGGVYTSDLIQAGTQAIVENGEVHYEAWYERLPEPSRRVPFTVRAGDRVTVSVTETSPDLWYISFVNDTTGRHYGFSTRYQSSRSSAEWVQEMPSLALRRGSQFIPLNDFGSITFRGASTVENGVAKTAQEAGAEPLAMHTLSGVPLALPSLLGEDGASFNVVRTDAEPIVLRMRAPLYSF